MTPEMATALVEAGDHPASALTVLYDERCPLCRKLKGWLAGQVMIVPIEFMAAGSETARRRYPRLDHERTFTVLTVISTAGAVYEGERAWLACAWALPRWRPMAEHFAGRGHARALRLVARGIDRYRMMLIEQSCETGCRVAG